MLILQNARIVGSEKHSGKSEALAIRAGKILAVGSNAGVLSLADRNSEILDMHGKTILPGLTDSHIHLQHLGRILTMVNCETDHILDCFDRLRDRAKTTTVGEWILGHGWNQNQWAGGFTDIDLLHQVSDEHPIYITAKSLHAAWANKRALEIAGITHETADPQDGIIGRNAEGYPNGLLFENAMGLMSEFIPAQSGQTLVDNLHATQTELWKTGITAVHDFDGAECFSALQQLDRQNKLMLRVVKSLPLQNLEAAVQTGLRTGFGSDFLRIGSVKLFADGALGPQTAAMLEPYETNHDNSGILMLSREEIIHYGKIAAKNGLSLAIHAIGDKANREVIDAYAELRLFEQENHLPGLHHRIEHVQVLAEADLSRLAENNIIASMQPIHLVSDMDTADHFWGERARYAYPFSSLLENGTRLIFGSDAPVESFNPFLGMYAALTRSKFDQPLSSSWYPEEKISLENILAAYTINPAIVSDWDGKIGRISAGNYADLIVLPANPFEIDPFEIKDLLPNATMVAGQWVWQEDEL
ncbi:MAG: amidohydrolase [Anaerolineaceae bacterium]|nr:amidohydrolase [Anaerolineaceae bacterium]